MGKFQDLSEEKRANYLVLLKKVPREISHQSKFYLLAKSGGSLAIFWGSLFLLLAGFLGARHTFVELWSLRNPEVTSGKITYVDYTGLTVNEKEQFEAGFSFEHNGKQYEGFSYDLWPAPSPGKTVTIEYDPKNPQVARVRGMNYARFVVINLILVGIGLLLVLGGVLGWRSLARRVSLLERGELGKAELISCEPTNTSVNEQTVFKLVFHFKDPRGEVHEIKIRTHDDDKINRLSDEDEEPVLYDPANPGSWVLLDSFVLPFELVAAGLWGQPSSANLAWAVVRILLFLGVAAWAFHLLFFV